VTPARDLSTRTPAEELWLWRRSRGLTQRGAAALLGVGRGRLSRAERDGVLGLPHAAWRPVSDPGTDLLLALARRRFGRGLRATADAAGISHRTLLAWERDGSEALVAWWERRGFTFARVPR
jgi:transcriptional regulator with XRE-family HTH domain